MVHATQGTRPRQVGVPTLIAYSLPALPAAMLVLPLYIYLPTVYAGELGLGLTAVGAALLVARLWDVVSDPLIGVLSDRTQGRFGRRRPWIAVAAPLIAISVWFLFRPPEDASLLWLGGFSALLYLGWTMLSLPYFAWGAEISPDYHERARITGAREAAALAGTVAALTLPFALGLAEDRPAALGLLGLVVAIAVPVTVAILLLRVPEPPAAAGRRIPWKEGTRLIARNRPFRRLLSAYLANGVANGLPATLILLYVAHVVEDEPQTGLYLLAYFFAGVLATPFWIWLSRRTAKHRAWRMAMLWNCAFFAVAPFLGPGDGDLYLVVCIATGLALGADLALPPAMQADVVDVDRAASGAERAGLYFALWGMATKLALALAVGIAFPLLDLAGFNAESGGNEGLWALAWLYGGLPILFKLAAIWIMRGYDLDAVSLARVQQDQLAER